MNGKLIPLLIVEDNPFYADILQRVLPTMDDVLQFEPKCVDTAEKAMLELTSRRYDLVLLDYKLPGLDGLEVLAQIRKLSHEDQPAVIMLTGMGKEELAVQAMKAGASDYLPKDKIDAASLRHAITGALRQRQLEDQVARTTEELRLRNDQLEADLQLASEIQRAFLPQHFPVFPPGVASERSALRFHPRYLPSGLVGGDYFDVMPLSDTAAGVFICDVMGNGVRAALVTAILRAEVEELSARAHEPGVFLTEINRALMAALRRSPMPMFASAFYLVADVGRGELRYASAGHPRPLHLRRAAGSVESLAIGSEQTGPALGVFENLEYATYHAPLNAGDLVLLFTDGVFEVEGAHDELFGMDRLREAVQGRAGVPAARLLDEILQEIQEFAVRKQFTDDVCLVGVEVAPTDPQFK